MLADERKKLIALYRDGYATVAEALLKITPEELDAKPGPGRWSVREIVHHLADSEMTSAIRLRLLLAEDRPDDSRLRSGRVRAAAALRPAARVVSRSVPSGATVNGRAARADDAGRLVREGTHTESGRYGAKPGCRFTPSTPTSMRARSSLRGTRR